MAASSSLPKRSGPAVPFLISAVCAALMPTSIGYQDLAALLARQPGVSERWRDHLIASPFGTIHAATFSFSLPLGTAMPRPLGSQPVNFDPGSLDVKTWSAGAPALIHRAIEIAYPTVNRRLKGDRLPVQETSPPEAQPASLPQLQPIGAPPAPQPSLPATPGTPRPKSANAGADGGGNADASASAALPNLNGEDDAATADALELGVVGLGLAEDGEPLAAASSSFDAPSFLNADPAERNAQLYFGVAAMGSRGGLEQWTPGAAPVLVSPPIDPDIKLSALTGAGGESIAGKDDAGRLHSPADRLGLAGKPRANAEKCLADAVYFEARGEPMRGQQAVAQVVMNRVFSGFYPNNVCGVVYQNANRHLACQFTFACEGKDLSRIDEVDMWEQAKRIAKDMLDGKIWLAEVGHATHYHAYWVHPSWVHEMKKMYQLGVHTFYRPRAWGDGADAPVWGAPPAAASNTAAAKSDAAKAPQAAATPAVSTAAKSASTAKL
jgi:hypothetical protein